MVALHLLTGRGTTTVVTPPVFRSGGVTEDEDNVLGRGLSQPVCSLSS